MGHGLIRTGEGKQRVSGLSQKSWRRVMGRSSNKELRIKAYKRMYQFGQGHPIAGSRELRLRSMGLDEIALVKPALIKAEKSIEGRYFVYMAEFAATGGVR